MISLFKCDFGELSNPSLYVCIWAFLRISVVFSVTTTELCRSGIEMLEFCFNAGLRTRRECRQRIVMAEQRGCPYLRSEGGQVAGRRVFDGTAGAGRGMEERWPCSARVSLKCQQWITG